LLLNIIGMVLLGLVYLGCFLFNITRPLFWPFPNPYYTHRRCRETDRIWSDEDKKKMQRVIAELEK